jgi:hypothetical protein
MQAQSAWSRGWETNSGFLVNEAGMLNRVTKRDGGERVGFGLFDSVRWAAAVGLVDSEPRLYTGIVVRKYSVT